MLLGRRRTMIGVLLVLGQARRSQTLRKVHLRRETCPDYPVIRRAGNSKNPCMMKTMSFPPSDWASTAAHEDGRTVPSGVVGIPASDHDVEMRFAELLHCVNETPSRQAMQDRSQPRGLDIPEIALGHVDCDPG